MTVRYLQFGEVVKVLAENVWGNSPSRRFSRQGWNGPGQYIELQNPDKNSKMTQPYIFIKTVQGDLIPWLVSQADLLAFDWYEVVE